MAACSEKVPKRDSQARSIFFQANAPIVYDPKVINDSDPISDTSGRPFTSQNLGQLPFYMAGSVANLDLNQPKPVAGLLSVIMGSRWVEKDEAMGREDGRSFSDIL